MKYKITIYSVIIFVASFVLLMGLSINETLSESLRIETNTWLMITSLTSFIVILTIIFGSTMKKLEKLWFIPFALLGVILATNLKSTDYYKTTKLEMNLTRLERFENLYPNSDELNEVKAYMQANNYDAIRKMDRHRFYYLDNALPIAAEVKKHGNKELTALFDKAIKDSYLNEVEDDLIQAKIKEILTERLNASI